MGKVFIPFVAVLAIVLVGCTAQPTTKQPVTEQPTTEQPATEQPTTEQPTTEQPTIEQPTDLPSADKQGTTKKAALEDELDTFEEFTFDGLTLKAVGYYVIGSDTAISDQVSIISRIAIRFTVVDSDTDYSDHMGFIALGSLVNGGAFTLVDASGKEFICSLSAAGADMEYIDIGSFEIAATDSDYYEGLTLHAPGKTIPVRLLDEIDSGFTSAPEAD